MMKYPIPKEVLNILEKLESNGFEAFLVGGCVRDLLLSKTPKDCDITTNAKPEEIQEIFENSFYENEFGTVGVKVQPQGSDPWVNRGQTPTRNEADNIVEVTTYRKEEAYTDKRHPDKVEFTSNIEDDLARRDFTVNAIALKVTSYQLPVTSSSIRDPFGGQEDLKNKLIRAVGDPYKRFEEDALRLMRAVRFSAQLGFNIEEGRKIVIKEKANLLRAISKERIRDEFLKIIDSQDPEKGVRLLQELGLLREFIPELEDGVGVDQNLHHQYTVFEHSVRSLGYAARYNYNTAVRLSALLHDIAKPRTKQGQGHDATFYGHEVVGARMVAKILDRLHFSKKLSEKVVTLVRYHMFYYDVGEVTEKSIRRLLRKVGPENIDELLEVRIAERKGSGVPKAEPYRLRHLKYMIDKVARDPLTVGMLKVSGDDVMSQLKIEPGPKVGYILNALLEEVIDEPKKNSRKYLVSSIKELGKLSDTKLKKMAQAGKEKLEGKEEEVDKKLKGRHYVK